MTPKSSNVSYIEFLFQSYQMTTDKFSTTGTSTGALNRGQLISKLRLTRTSCITAER
jgi:hypothetical protein